MLRFTDPKKATETYENFLKDISGRVSKNQRQIQDIITGKDRTGATIDKTVEEAESLENEMLKSVAGYLWQAERAQVDLVYERIDREKIEKDSLPRGRTYCCVMKGGIPVTQEDIKEMGLKETDLSVLFRLIPCVGFDTGILLNPDTGIPFIKSDDIAEYLGEKTGSDNKCSRAISRLIKSGILFRYGSVFMVNDFYIRCGQMTRGVMNNRKKYFEKYNKKQGKKQTNKQGKKSTQENSKIKEQEEPQTQAGRAKKTV